MEREVQLLQHGEPGVQILRVDPVPIIFKIFDTDGWDCSWLFLTTTTAKRSNIGCRVQPAWGVHVPIIDKWHVGMASRPTPGQAWETAWARFVWGLFRCLLQINRVVQATEQLAPGAQACLTNIPQSPFSYAHCGAEGLTNLWHATLWAVHSSFKSSTSMGAAGGNLYSHQPGARSVLFSEKKKGFIFLSSQPFHLSWPEISFSKHFPEGVFKQNYT